MEWVVAIVGGIFLGIAHEYWGHGTSFFYALGVYALGGFIGIMFILTSQRKKLGGKP